MPKTTPATIRCQPWCNDHATGSHPDDSFCRRTTPTGAALTWTPDEGPILWTRDGDDHTITEAETIARDLAALLATARTAVAA